MMSHSFVWLLSVPCGWSSDSPHDPKLVSNSVVTKGFVFLCQNSSLQCWSSDVFYWAHRQWYTSVCGWKKTLVWRDHNYMNEIDSLEGDITVWQICVESPHCLEK
jgi:hypothetical protein